MVQSWFWSISVDYYSIVDCGYMQVHLYATIVWNDIVDNPQNIYGKIMGNIF